MDKMIKIESSIMFNTRRFFNFPIKNNVRMSFWMEGSEYSTPCELMVSEQIDINIEYTIVIMLDNSYLKEINFPSKNIFYIGTFPIPIAKGTINKFCNA